MLIMRGKKGKASSPRLGWRPGQAGWDIKAQRTWKNRGEVQGEGSRTGVETWKGG